MKAGKDEILPGLSTALTTGRLAGQYAAGYAAK